MRRFASKIPGLTLVAVLLVAVGAGAQENVSDPDELHERLESARSRLAQIQDRAGTVEEQIASIDDQIAAVQEGLSASRALVDRTQVEIAVLQSGIKTKRQQYERVRKRATAVAISLYKAGPTANFEALLSVDSLDELTSGIEYSSAMTKEHNAVMVASKRLEAELRVQTAELEVKLAEAIKVRGQQEALAQNLDELKQAESAKLADLRDQIEGTRNEVDAIQDRSAEIAAELAAAAAAAAEAAPAPAAPAAVAAPAPPATLTSGASGFAWPFNGAITSGYGERWGRMHSGIDIDCVTGDPIRASKAGTVVSSSYDASGYGYYLVIDHGGGFASLYAHNSELYVSGGSVTQGQTIAACGSTGASTGDHLHFEIRVNGAPQDPLSYLP